MKILLVAEKELTKTALEGHFKPRGFDFVHYRNPIKAMDNIDEVDPDFVLFSAEDFPRHWKTFIAFMRQSRDREQTAFVLLTGREFSFEEAAKANHLEVNGIAFEAPEDRGELRKLEEVIARYSALREDRNDPRYIPIDGEFIEFILTHPTKYRLVTGVLYDLSPSGASFVPDDPKASSDIAAGKIIRHCSMKLDDRILRTSCKVIRNLERLALRFIDSTPDLEQAIIDFIDLRADRELELLLQEKA